jgi:hypothetical protein
MEGAILAGTWLKFMRLIRRTHSRSRNLFPFYYDYSELEMKRTPSWDGETKLNFTGRVLPMILSM